MSAAIFIASKRQSSFIAVFRFPQSWHERTKSVGSMRVEQEDHGISRRQRASALHAIREVASTIVWIGRSAIRTVSFNHHEDPGLNKSPIGLNQAMARLLPVLFVSLFLAAQTSSFAAEITPLAEKVSHRLSYMKDVAGYKAQNHLPIEDLAQEAKVLESAKSEAAKLGLDPVTVEPFIIAQINAAKAVEYRYLADWLAQPEAGWQPRPLDKVRQDIAQLSKEILQQVAQDLKSGPFTPSERASFFKVVHEPNLKESDRQQLFSTLLAIRLAK
ncbi:chorismate mutase [Labrys neptuniae]